MTCTLPDDDPFTQSLVSLIVLSVCFLIHSTGCFWLSSRRHEQLQRRQQQQQQHRDASSVNHVNQFTPASHGNNILQADTLLDRAYASRLYTPMRIPEEGSTSILPAENSSSETSLYVEGLQHLDSPAEAERKSRVKLLVKFNWVVTLVGAATNAWDLSGETDSFL